MIPESPNNLRLTERLALISDQALLEMVEKKPDVYTREAGEMIEAEVSRRGGMEALKERVKTAQKVSPSGDEQLVRWRVFLVAVFTGCGLLIYLLHGSYWFYWVCLFALIAAWFGVLFLPRHSPDDELKEMLTKAAQEQGAVDPDTHSESGK